uniref:Uncharacterized protein n=1 Tax=Anguilla anguilla TaxID=7936 RepID=A0A0E9TMW7_ANGAN
MSCCILGKSGLVCHLWWASDFSISFRQGL